MLEHLLMCIEEKMAVSKNQKLPGVTRTHRTVENEEAVLQIVENKYQKNKFSCTEC